jgi:ATP-binding cassette subfamily B protein
MKILTSYLRQYWRLIALALFLATVNQVFSLLDPLIFRYVIDNYATQFKKYTSGEFSGLCDQPDHPAAGGENLF